MCMWKKEEIPEHTSLLLFRDETQGLITEHYVQPLCTLSLLMFLRLLTFTFSLRKNSEKGKFLLVAFCKHTHSVRQAKKIMLSRRAKKKAAAHTYFKASIVLGEQRRKELRMPSFQVRKNCVPFNPQLDYL